MIVNDGNSQTVGSSQPQSPATIDLSGLINAGAGLLGQLLGGGEAQKKALEEQRIKLEAELRRKTEEGFRRLEILVGVGIVLILLVLSRR